MKLIDLLVQELPGMGGWPNGVPYLKQYTDGSLFCGNNYESLIRFVIVDDFDDGCVTQGQYEAALAARHNIYDDNWIDWPGGDCPLAAGTIIDARDRDGYVHTNEVVGKSACVNAIFWQRGACEQSNEIVAYRLRNPTENQPESQQPAWDGEGLPPVGCECEVRVGGNYFNLCRVVYSDKSCGVAFVYLGGDDEKYCGQIDCVSAKASSDYFRPIRLEADKKREAAINAILDDMRTIPCDLDFRDEVAVIYDAIAAGKVPGVQTF